MWWQFARFVRQWAWLLVLGAGVAFNAPRPDAGSALPVDQRAPSAPPVGTLATVSAIATRLTAHVGAAPIASEASPTTAPKAVRAPIRRGEAAATAITAVTTLAPVPPATPEPVTPTPLPAVPTPLAASTLSRVFATHFPPAQPGWPDDPSATAWFAVDGYHLYARSAHMFVAVGVPADLTLGDSVVTAVFRKLGGPPGGGYGIIARDTDSADRNGRYQAGRFYVAEVGDQGDIGIWRREQNGWFDLVQWTRSAAVHTGLAQNEVQFRTTGTELVLVVNGVVAATNRDSALETGGVGLFVGGDGNQVLASAFSVDVMDMQ